VAAICRFLGLPTIAKVSQEIITHEFAEPKNREICFSHFLPFTYFENDPNGGWFATIRDLSNGDLYLDDDQIRLKSLALSTLGIIPQILFTLLNLINRIIKLVSFAHFWHPSQEELSLGKQIWSFGADLLRVAFTPLIFLMMEIAAIYGIIAPYNGRKLYATFERCAYGDGKLAPCFQPRPDRHFFGGNLENPSSW